MSTSHASATALLQHAAHVGTWLDPAQAQSMAMPGIKLPGSSASRAAKWQLELTSSGHEGGTFQLTCRTGYDHRGLLSSSGLTDGEVDLTLYSAHGTWCAQTPGVARLLVSATETTHIHGTTPAQQLALPGLPAQPAADTVQVDVLASSDGFVITLESRASGALALHSPELSAGAPIIFVPAPSAQP